MNRNLDLIIEMVLNQAILVLVEGQQALLRSEEAGLITPEEREEVSFVLEKAASLLAALRDANVNR